LIDFLRIAHMGGGAFACQFACFAGKLKSADAGRRVRPNFNPPPVSQPRTPSASRSPRGTLSHSPSPSVSGSPSPLSSLLEMGFLLRVAVSALGVSAAPLPRLNISSLTISGISSGADLAAHFSVAFSDVTSGVAIFAGEPWLCATTRFPGEPVFTCAAAEAAIGQPGPGCGGLPTGFAPCEGCGTDGNSTVLYDHCKGRGPGTPPQFLDAPTLVGAARAAARADLIAPLAGLSSLRAYLYRGTLDSCYLDGSVNFTAAFFSAFATDPAEQVAFVANVPSGHCTPSVDPWVPRSSCGHGRGAPPAVENCGYE
jgi:hypothetical protein